MFYRGTGIESYNADFKTAETRETAYNNTIVEKGVFDVENCPQEFQSVLESMAGIFQKVGALDSALVGSGEKIVVGAQSAQDQPGDLDYVTVAGAVTKIWEMYVGGDDLGKYFEGSVTVHEPREFSTREKYGKSLVLSLNVKMESRTYDIDIFGEGDGVDTSGYGGSVQLGNSQRCAEIWKYDNGVQVLSAEDQRRQYALVLVRELMVEGAGDRAKIPSRIVSLLQFAEKNPDTIIQDLELFRTAYQHLPKELENGIGNIQGLLKWLEHEQKKGEPDNETIEFLPQAELTQKMNQIKGLLDAESILNREHVDIIVEIIERLNLSEEFVTNYEELRHVYETLYEIVGKIYQQTALDEDGGMQAKDLVTHALTKSVSRNEYPRNIYLSFLKLKLEHLSFRNLARKD